MEEREKASETLHRVLDQACWFVGPPTCFRGGPLASEGVRPWGHDAWEGTTRMQPDRARVALARVAGWFLLSVVDTPPPQTHHTRRTEYCTKALASTEPKTIWSCSSCTGDALDWLMVPSRNTSQSTQALMDLIGERRGWPPVCAMLKVVDFVRTSAGKGVGRERERER